MKLIEKVFGTHSERELKTYYFPCRQNRSAASYYAGVK